MEKQLQFEPDEIKRTVLCKGIDIQGIDVECIKSYIPKAGDLALFRVKRLGKHLSIQSEKGINCSIFPDDLFFGVFGNRYATEQFEGYVPETILDEYDILGKGGIIGQIHSMHSKFDIVGTTKVELVGYALDQENNIINTIYYNQHIVHFSEFNKGGAQIILSLGSSMDSGKTTSAAFLCRMLKKAGNRVGYIKLTGTAYTKDKTFVNDCGASVVTDFTDAGFPSTFKVELKDLLNLYSYLIHQLNKHKVEFIVVEIADGLLQLETHALLSDEAFMNTINNVMYSANDSLSAIHGVQMLKEMGIDVFILSGVFTASPLLVQEVKDHLDITIYTIADFCQNQNVMIDEDISLVELAFDVN